MLILITVMKMHLTGEGDDTRGTFWHLDGARLFLRLPQTNWTFLFSISGSMAERTKLSAYLFFSLLNTIVYCFPAHWVWSSNGWLNKMGMIDVAGAGPVHLVGGITGLMATIVLGPRYNRWDESNRLKMASPTNILLGTFMLWYVKNMCIRTENCQILC